MDRRDFIRLIGGGTVMAAGLSGCGTAPDASVAWVSPGSSERDVRRYALAHAILAPNPHNRGYLATKALRSGHLLDPQHFVDPTLAESA